MAVMFCPTGLSAAAHVESAIRFVKAAVPVHVALSQIDIPTLFTAIWVNARAAAWPPVVNVRHSSR